MSESNGWGVFTVVCMILLVGLMEHQGMINLIDDNKNQQTEGEMTTGEAINPAGKMTRARHAGLIRHMGWYECGRMEYV